MKKILMVMLDGIGLSDKYEGNAFKNANMKNFNKLYEDYPHANIDCSGEVVGLPKGQAGNDMIGYMTLASGEIIKQRSSFVRDFTDIDSLATNPVLKSAIEQVKKKKSTFHIIGLMSDGGINSNIDDVINIIEFLKTQDISIGVDFIADGRDVEAKSALKYIDRILSTGVPIVSICGRYYAMNNDGKWDRTRIYYDLVRNGVGLKIKEIPLALKNCYIRNITDEFLPPMIVEPDKNLKDNDVVFWINYKDDGINQTLMALSNPYSITEFQTRENKNISFITMYPQGENILSTPLINQEVDMSNSMGQYLAKLEFSQARIATKESYDNVTYYFNGESKQKIPKCNDYLINVGEVIPGKEKELNSAGVAKQIIKCMEKDTDFILASFSAIEEVSKTGNFENTVKILNFIDECLGKIIENAELNFYTLIIASTFGSVEEMIDEEGHPTTIHTNNKTPLIICDNKITLKDGALPDIAPTILSYMDISIPESMKSSSILIENND